MAFRAQWWEPLRTVLRGSTVLFSKSKILPGCDQKCRLATKTKIACLGCRCQNCRTKYNKPWKRGSIFGTPLQVSQKGQGFEFRTPGLRSGIQTLRPSANCFPCFTLVAAAQACETSLDRIFRNQPCRSSRESMLAVSWGYNGGFVGFSGVGDGHAECALQRQPHRWGPAASRHASAGRGRGFPILKYAYRSGRLDSMT